MATKLYVGGLPYATKDSELQEAFAPAGTVVSATVIMDRMSGGPLPKVSPVVTPERILDAKKVVGEVYVDEKIKEYIIDVVTATRDPSRYKLDELGRFIEYGASPRASIALNVAARAHAFLRHRGYVTPEDIKSIGPDVLRHRIVVTYEAEAEEITSEEIVRRIFDAVEVP